MVRELLSLAVQKALTATVLVAKAGVISESNNNNAKNMAKMYFFILVFPVYSFYYHKHPPENTN